MSLYRGTGAFIHRSSCPWARGRCPARQPESGGNVGGRLQPRVGEGSRRPPAIKAFATSRRWLSTGNGRLGRAGVRNMGLPGPLRGYKWAVKWQPRVGESARRSPAIKALTTSRRWLSTMNIRNLIGERNMGLPVFGGRTAAAPFRLVFARIVGK